MPTPPDDILLNKASVIERCLRRVHEEHGACPELDDFTHVDALTLNIERACQAAIDMAMHLVARDHLGVPQGAADAFALLQRRGIIEAPLADSLRAMVGFRNVAIHQYEELDLAILEAIVTRHLGDWVTFCTALGVRVEN